jgi:deoxyribonuclease-4
MRRIGCHVSIAGNIWESLERAKALGCNAMQIFSRNPRSWQAAEFNNADVDRFRTLKKQYGISPVVAHIPYIINLASPDDGLYKKSMIAYIEDIGRADLLGIEYLVTHLGSHVGSGEDNGIKRFSQALDQILKKARARTTILLENTAGSGSWIGYKFEHIKRIMEGLSDPGNVGVCLDTAHTFEAGYDIKTKKGLEKTLKDFDRLVGTDRIRVVHFNDSLSELGSNVDRHQHIGKGNIGVEAMKRIINHPKLAHAAFILETPKKTDRDDKRNLATVRKMVKC